MIRVVLTLFFLSPGLVCAGDLTDAKPSQAPQAVKIWSQAPHNAFTDLVRFQGRWFCVFREGKAHVSPDGALRVLSSTDGVKWESAALIKSDNSDLRDAKITVTPDGHLMLCGAEALHDRSKHSHQSLAWFSRDGRTWSEKHPIGDPDFWLWRVTWHKGVAYGIGYGCGKDRSVRLYASKDGKKFDTLVERLFETGYPNETSIVFNGDTAYCLLRRDGTGKGNNTGMLGVSQAPFTKWEWKDLGRRIGGPHMIRLPDGRFVVAVRLYDKKQRTSLCWLDPLVGSLTEFRALPSGGDTSYAGLVLYQDQLWVSYYSSHEGKTSIYLANVPIENPVRDIGSRRELFVDRYLIERLENTTLRLHEPRPTPPMTEPADNMEYGTVIKDGDHFRLYTRDGRGARFDGDTREVTRYCESKDGIHWTKPKLGLTEIDGSKANNVILNEAPFCHNFSPFLDRRPGVPADQRFKALAGTVKSGLFAFVSADGIRWKKWREKPVIRYTKEYAFDSQNVSFWSESEGCYVCYFRHFLDKQLRSVCRTTSTDFVTWSEPVPMKPNFPGEHLYTTLTHPYFNAPHIYIAMPTRFHPSRGESTDILFMTARGDAPYDRTFREAFIRPGLDSARWGNRSNYAALNVVPTGEAEMSIYVTPFRRLTLRTDGFASVHAGADPGEMLTRLLRFTGKELVVNYSTSAGGSLRVEVQNEAGKPVPGFRLEDCLPLVGDSVGQPVRWKNTPDLSRLAGQPVRLRVVLQDGDLYAIQFRQGER
ncbi:MAG: exo-alpha-sialidase [Gemmataceae bacterium]